MRPFPVDPQVADRLQAGDFRIFGGSTPIGELAIEKVQPAAALKVGSPRNLVADGPVSRMLVQIPSWTRDCQ